MKIYLARPNKLPDIIFNATKDILKKDFPGCKLVFYQKGTKYTNKELLLCNLLIVLTINNQPGIGKGLTSQIKSCLTAKMPVAWIRFEDDY